MQKLATQVMRYLAQRGSKLKVVAFSTYMRADKRPPQDGNGHRWPDYYYLRGRSIDVRGIERVTALPLEQPWLEMRESSILYDY